MHTITDVPCGWVAFPGNSVDGGNDVAYGVDGDTCTTMCLEDSTCGGLDFDSGYGICYLHTSETVCNSRTKILTTYHLEKPVCCK